MKTIKDLLNYNGIQSCEEVHPLTGKEITVTTMLSDGTEGELFKSKVVGAYSFLATVMNQTILKGEEPNLIFAIRELLVLENEMVIEPDFLLGGDSFCFEFDHDFHVPPMEQLRDAIDRHNQLMTMIQLAKLTFKDQTPHRYIQVIADEEANEEVGMLVNRLNDSVALYDPFTCDDPIELESEGMYEIESVETIFIERARQVRKEIVYHLKDTNKVALRLSAFASVDVVIVNPADLVIY